MLNRSIPAALFVVALAAGAYAQQAPVVAQAPAAPRPAPRSAEVAADGRVTFRVEAPKASEVILNGDWPGGRGLALTKEASGIWTLTTAQLTPEIWQYTYAIDGVTTLDPGNPRVVRDGVRRLNTVFVPGPASSLYQVSKVPHGTVAAVWYPSPTLKTPRRMLVYTPPGYDAGTATYPVLHLFHGGGGDEEAWNELGATSTILDNLIAQGKATPMIVVLPNANWRDSSVLETAGARTQAPAPAGAPTASPMPAQDYGVAEQEIVNGMIPYVESHYRVAAGREHRAIAGLSMGGGITIAVGLKRLDVFSHVAQFSTGMFGGTGPGGYAPFNIDAISPGFLKDGAATNAKLKLLYFSCGDDDPRMPFQKKVAEEFRAAKIALTFRNFAGAHEWRVWRNSLADVARMLFK